MRVHRADVGPEAPPSPFGTRPAFTHWDRRPAFVGTRHHPVTGFLLVSPQRSMGESGWWFDVASAYTTLTRGHGRSNGVRSASSRRSCRPCQPRSRNNRLCLFDEIHFAPLVFGDRRIATKTKIGKPNADNGKNFQPNSLDGGRLGRPSDN